MADLSAYEVQRARNVSANQERLVLLGIEQARSNLRSPPRPIVPRTKRVEPPREPSSRLPAREPGFYDDAGDAEPTRGSSSSQKTPARPRDSQPQPQGSRTEPAGRRQQRKQRPAPAPAVEYMHYDVPIPPGLKAGDVFQLRVAGEVASVSVPEGMGGGQLLQIHVARLRSGGADSDEETPKRAKLNAYQLHMQEEMRRLKQARRRPQALFASARRPLPLRSAPKRPRPRRLRRMNRTWHRTRSSVERPRRGRRNRGRTMREARVSEGRVLV